MGNPTLLWFRSDLRLTDNPALHWALDRGGPVIPVFVWSPEEEGDWAPGAASLWWLHHSLESLGQDLRKAGGSLVIRRGATREALLALIEETGADAVTWNRRYEPGVIARDTELKAALRERGLAVETHNASLLFEPWTVKTGAGNPFQVFTAFWKSCLAGAAPAPPLPAPTTWPTIHKGPRSEAVDSLGLLPTIDWAAGFRDAWQPGEHGAQEQLTRFLAGPVAAYADERDRPDFVGTSRLSPHLHFGEIGPRQIWHAAQHHLEIGTTPGLGRGTEVFLKEVGWREFAFHLLFHFPHTPLQPLRPEFSKFPWLDDPKGLRAWKRGQTGFPIIDAGLRELWTTGWMHNRVRMIAASFLVKDLLVPWQEGARWFWDTLVDADLASNTLGWQWTAGCGADAAPFFRVFNPILQGVKFDPQGQYVRRWVPELAGLPNDWIHRPWEAPADVLAAGRVTLGATYPEPIVDHGLARQRALAAFQGLKR